MWKGNPGNTKKREKRKNCRIDKQAHCLPLKLFLVLPESANRENSRSLLNTWLKSIEVVCISYFPLLTVLSNVLFEDKKTSWLQPSLGTFEKGYEVMISEMADAPLHPYNIITTSFWCEILLQTK
jgi:hypothetical protein